MVRPTALFTVIEGFAPTKCLELGCCMNQGTMGLVGFMGLIGRATVAAGLSSEQLVHHLVDYARQLWRGRV